MNFTEDFRHFAACHFGIPVIDSGKKGKNSPRRHHIVKVSDHVIRVMQMNVGSCQSQRKSREPANAEHGKKSDGKKHGCAEADGSPPEAERQGGQQYHRRNGNNHGRDLKK